jgi:hypothetical protein
MCQYYLFTAAAMLFVHFCANTLGDGANKYQRAAVLSAASAWLDQMPFIDQA